MYVQSRAMGGPPKGGQASVGTSLCLDVMVGAASAAALWALRAGPTVVLVGAAVCGVLRAALVASR